jgi:hypothetical protein
MKEKREINRFLHVTPRRIFEQLDPVLPGTQTGFAAVHESIGAAIRPIDGAIWQTETEL